MQRIKNLLKRLNLLFLGVVVLPTAIAWLYFGSVASPAFHSESRFTIRSAQRSAPDSPISALISGSLFTRSQDESYVIQDYLLSRDALRALEEKLPLRQNFSDSRIDTLQRFPQPWHDATFESFHRFFMDKVQVSFDPVSGITTLKTVAPTAALSQQINAELLKLSEALINALNTRGRADLLKLARQDQADAEQRLKDASAAIAGFRSKGAVFDPERQASLQLQQVNRLQDELLSVRTQVSQVRALTPDNPQLPALRRRAEILEAEVAAETNRVLGGTDKSLASKAAKFDRLTLEKTLAERQLAATLVALETAQQQSDRKQMYLETIVQPSTPDRAAEPRRVRAVMLVVVFSVMLYGVLSLLLAGVREHKER
jgi:capsular polysaccharide transport system permease protein